MLCKDCLSCIKLYRMDANKKSHLRVGIMGAANIARKNVAAIQNLVTQCKIVAIASRSQSKADSLRDHVLEEWRGNVQIIAGDNAYDLLIQRDDVDAVYIPLPVNVKKEWIMKALEAKKHVLCEKPVSNGASNYQEMIDSAKRVNRFIMDGTMFVHNRRTDLFLNHIAQRDVFGQVTRINSEFTFKGDEDFFSNNIRTTKEGDPYGCIGDLGWYCVRLAQLVFRKVDSGIVTKAQTTNWKLNHEGVPIDATCLVFFQDAASKINQNEHILSFHCSFLHPLRQRVTICGTEQSLDMHDYVIPNEGPNTFMVHGQDLTINDSYSIQSNDLTESPSGPVQEVLMWRNFQRYCSIIEAKGWTDDGAEIISSMSLENQKIMDALMQSIDQEGKVVNLL